MSPNSDDDDQDLGGYQPSWQKQTVSSTQKNNEKLQKKKATKKAQNRQQNQPSLGLKSGSGPKSFAGVAGGSGSSITGGGVKNNNSYIDLTDSGRPANTLSSDAEARGGGNSNKNNIMNNKNQVMNNQRPKSHVS